jgi:hypothetical protein
VTKANEDKTPKCNQPHEIPYHKEERQQKIYFNFDDHHIGMDKSTSVGNVLEKPRREFHYTRLDLVLERRKLTCEWKEKCRVMILVAN